MYTSKTYKKIVLHIYFICLLIKQFKKCCLATVAKEKDFGIASISKNDRISQRIYVPTFMLLS